MLFRSLLFSVSGLPEQPQTISYMHLVLYAFNLLFPYLIPKPISHEYKLQKLYASPSESKLKPSSGLTTLSVGSSTYLRTDCSIALILDGHGVLSGAHYPALIFSSTQGPTD